MAFLGKSVHGDGLFRAHDALAALEADPNQLQRARNRFDNDLPPAYSSDQSGTTTRTGTPPTEDERALRLRRDELGIEWSASKPYDQFERQTAEERDGILESIRKRTWKGSKGQTYDMIAYDIVKKRWEEQGLWSEKWSAYATGIWKHEQPIDLGSESETDPDAPLFGKKRRKKSEEKRQAIAEVRRREREASRPYHQFIHQLSKERERICNELDITEDNSAFDINTTAYTRVKSTWIKRKIWDQKWGMIPGMFWKHERPFNSFLVEHGVAPYDEAPVPAATATASATAPATAPASVTSRSPPRQPLFSGFTNPMPGNIFGPSSSMTGLTNGHMSGNEAEQRVEPLFRFGDTVEPIFRFGDTVEPLFRFGDTVESSADKQMSPILHNVPFSTGLHQSSIFRFGNTIESSINEKSSLALLQGPALDHPEERNGQSAARSESQTGQERSATARSRSHSLVAEASGPVLPYARKLTKRRQPKPATIKPEVAQHLSIPRAGSPSAPRRRSARLQIMSISPPQNTADKTTTPPPRKGKAKPKSAAKPKGVTKRQSAKPTRKRKG